MTNQTRHADDKHADKDEETSGPKLPTKMPTQDAWRVQQGALNSLRLADPPLAIDGIPGPLTLEAAKGLVPLIQHVQKAQVA